MTMNRRHQGFTLAEMMVASTIGAFIAMVSIASLRAISASSATVDSVVSRASEVRYAMDMLRRDLVNLQQFGDTSNQRLVGLYVQEGDMGTSYLTFRALCRNKARSDQPEAEMYELSYYLQQDQDHSVLVRQQWPNPQVDLEPGGVVMTIAENVQLFFVRYYDGQLWAEEWPEDMENLPDLVEITIIGEAPTQGGQPITETVMVNIARTVGVGEDTGTDASGAVGSITAPTGAE